ncbi:hypothetical protein HDU76_008974, partial [Blyttiomyces sp. JEL0837]
MPGFHHQHSPGYVIMSLYLLLASALVVMADVVSVPSYTMAPDGTLSGLLTIQNLAYSKSITIYYQSSVTGWSSSNNITASYSSGLANTNFETWTFSGKTNGALAFY